MYFGSIRVVLLARCRALCSSSLQLDEEVFRSDSFEGIVAGSGGAASVVFS